MLEENNVDFGAIQIHKEAIADITCTAVSELEGVSLIPKSLTDTLLELWGKKRYSGVRITIDRDNQINIEVRIVIKYGMSIPSVGRQVQEAIRTAIERLADVNLKDINVKVCGIERGNP